MQVESWIAGRWHTPGDEGTALLDATSGVEVARFSTAPVAAAEALEHARTVGGPALRAMSFHERAAVQDPAPPRAGRGPLGRAGARPGRRARGDLRAADDGPRVLMPERV